MHMSWVQSSLLTCFALLPAAVTAPGGWLGVVLSDDGSAVIIEVIPGSPAERVGLRVHDRVVSVDGVRTADASAVGQAVGQRKVGERLRITVQRGAVQIALVAQLVARPLDQQPPSDRATSGPSDDRPGAPPGESVADATPQPAEAVDPVEPPKPTLGLDVEERSGGLFILEVIEGGACARAGLPDQVVLLTVGGVRVLSFEQLDRALEPLRPGQRIDVEVEGEGGAKQRFDVILGGQSAGGEAVAPVVSAPALSGPTVLVFGNEWDGRGLQQKQVLDDPAVRFASGQHRIEVRWMEFEPNRSYADALKVETLPATVLVRQDGSSVALLSGYQPAEKLAQAAADLRRNVDLASAAAEPVPGPAPEGGSARAVEEAMAAQLAAEQAMAEQAAKQAALEAEVSRLNGRVEGLEAELAKLRAQLTELLAAGKQPRRQTR